MIKLNRSKNLNLLFVALGMGFSFVYVAIMVMAQLIAYVQPRKMVILDFNRYGEATLELIMLPVILAFIIYGWICLYKELKK